jgi:DNA primase
MLTKIPAEFIDSVLNRIDIVELINARVSLKKAGQNFIACCPFHDEKTPSFTVSPSKQFYHCFGCGAHGSAINFLMTYDQLTFRDAVETLSAKAGLTVPSNDDTTTNKSIDLNPHYAILTQADTWFCHQLHTHPQAHQAKNYLKQRGLTESLVADYGLGYAPPGWNELHLALGVDAITVQNLIINGLIIEQSGQYHDRFRNRIIFPIRDRKGRTLGFGGRVLDDSKPKYLNSPETPLFHKGQELYGWFEARRAMRIFSQILIVEGYMDVIALAQFNIRYAVATLGTAINATQVETLLRTCKRLIFCFDGDQAGQQAAWRAVNVVVPLTFEGREFKFMFLPNGEDPDTMIRKIGTAAFEQRLAHAHNLSDVIFEHLSANLDLNILENKARVAEQVRPMLEKMPAGIYRNLLLAHLEKLTGFSGVVLNDTWQKTKPRLQMSYINRKTTQLAKITKAQLATAIILQQPHLAEVANQCATDWYSLSQSDAKLLLELINILHAQPHLTTAALVERWRDKTAFEEINRLAQYRLSDRDVDWQQELFESLRGLNETATKNFIPTIPKGLRPSELTDEEKAKMIKLLHAPH